MLVARYVTASTFGRLGRGEPEVFTDPLRVARAALSRRGDAPGPESRAVGRVFVARRASVLGDPEVAPSIDGLLAIKGVVEVAEPEGDEEEDKAARAAAAEAFDKALDELMREWRDKTPYDPRKDLE